MAKDQFGGGVSRRAFLAAGGAVGLLGVAGCTEKGGLPARPDDGDGGGDGGGSDGGGGDLSGSISITGSSTVFPLASAVSEEFQTLYSDVEIDVQSTGSGGGFANFFCPGDSQMNNASRPIQNGEVEQCESNGVTPHEIKVATDALTVVVNNDNDWATELTFDQLAEIWGPEAGEDQRWSDIDSSWPDEKIERFGAAETSGTFDYFTETVNGEKGAHTQAYEPSENDRSIVVGVRGSKYAIGYFGFSYYYNNPDAVTAVAIDDGDGPVEPKLETASSGDYPLSRPLFTYVAKERLADDHIAEFCKYFVEQSKNEKIVADEVGYVPNTTARAALELQELETAIREAAGNSSEQRRPQRSHAIDDHRDTE